MHRTSLISSLYVVLTLDYISQSKTARKFKIGNLLRLFYRAYRIPLTLSNRRLTEHLPTYGRLLGLLLGLLLGFLLGDFLLGLLLDLLLGFLFRHVIQLLL